MNKFLDDSKIIKKNKKENIVENSEIEESIEIDDVELDPIKDVEEEKESVAVEEKVVVKEKQKPVIEEKVEEKKVERKIKTKKDIIIDLLDRFETQLITKEVDIELYHRLFENAKNKSERDRYSMTYENLGKEIKEIKQRKEILQSMFNEIQ